TDGRPGMGRAVGWIDRAGSRGRDAFSTPDVPRAVVRKEANGNLGRVCRLCGVASHCSMPGRGDETNPTLPEWQSSRSASPQRMTKRTQPCQNGIRPSGLRFLPASNEANGLKGGKWGGGAGESTKQTQWGGGSYRERPGTGGSRAKAQ